MSRDTDHVFDIIESARMACSYVADIERDDFVRNVQLQDAVIRRIEILGEAARRVSAQFREQHPEIPWSDMIGVRNWLAHGYDDVDLDLVWVTVQEEVPELLNRLVSLVPPASDPSQEHG